MLVLSREVGERIQIGEDIFITILRSGRRRVSVGVDAPKELVIKRIGPDSQFEEKNNPIKNKELS